MTRDQYDEEPPWVELEHVPDEWPRWFIVAAIAITLAAVAFAANQFVQLWDAAQDEPVQVEWVDR